MGLVMSSNGDDPSKVTDEAFGKAIEKLKSAVDSGQIQKFTGNDYAAALAGGLDPRRIRVVGRRRAARSSTTRT